MHCKRFVLQFTLPNGGKVVASRVGSKFALAPLPIHGLKGTFLTFGSVMLAARFLADMRLRNKGKSYVLDEMNPEVLPVVVKEGGAVFPELEAGRPKAALQLPTLP